MMKIYMNEDDRRFFNEIITNNPDSFYVSNIRNFDGAALVQIIVDSAVALSAPFLTALGLFLNYKIAQMQEKTKERELDIKERELQQKLTEKNLKQTNTEQQNDYFEIKVSSKTRKITYTNESFNEKETKGIIDDIVSILGSSQLE